MVREPVRHGDGECLMRYSFDDIADLQVILVKRRRIQKDWLVPRRVVQDEKPGQISVPGIAALNIEGVKSPDSAGVPL